MKHRTPPSSIEALPRDEVRTYPHVHDGCEMLAIYDAHGILRGEFRAKTEDVTDELLAALIAWERSLGSSKLRLIE